MLRTGVASDKVVAGGRKRTRPRSPVEETEKRPGTYIDTYTVAIHWRQAPFKRTLAISTCRVSFRGGERGQLPPLDILCPPPLGFKMLNDLPVYCQLVTLTIRSNF